MDDADIFLTYAENLSQGHGFVFNPGGERVEGFSSLLWVLISAFGFWLSPRPELGLIIANAVFCSLALSFMLSILDRVQFRREVEPLVPAEGSMVRPHRRRLETFYLIWILSSPAFLAWNVLSLMENGVWTCALLGGVGAAVLLLLRERISERLQFAFCVALGTVVVTRPEAMVWAPLLLAVVFLGRRYGGSSRWSALRSILPGALVYSATLAALILFRTSYFGYPLPNTYYAKVSPDVLYNLMQGARYLAGFILANPLNALCASAAPIGLLAMLGAQQPDGKRGAERSPEARRLLAARIALGVLGVAGLLIPTLNGGDHFEFFRFYQPIWPLLVLIAFVLLSRMPMPRSWLVRTGMAPVLLLVLYTSHQPKWHDLFRYESFVGEFALAKTGREAGRVFNLLEDGPGLPSVGVITAGGFALAYHGEAVDLMGLNNIAMAHSPGDRRGFKNHSSFQKETFFELRPGMLLPRYQSGEEEERPFESYGRESFANKVLKGLLFDERFKNSYAPAVLCGIAPEVPRMQLFGYFRRDLLAAYAAAGVVIELLPEDAGEGQ